MFRPEAGLEGAFPLDLGTAGIGSNRFEVGVFYLVGVINSGVL